MAGKDTDILDWKVQIKDIGRNGVGYRFVADESELVAVKNAYDLVSATMFELDVDLSPGRKGLVTFNGKITARVEQSCIVTLQPVFEKVDLSFVRLLTFEKPRPDKERDDLPSAKNKFRASEIDFTLDDADPPDIVAGFILDLGLIALEEFVLALDPYPRHDDAGEKGAFAYRDERGSLLDENREKNPFATLKK